MTHKTHPVDDDRAPCGEGKKRNIIMKETLRLITFFFLDISPTCACFYTANIHKIQRMRRKDRSYLSRKVQPHI